MTEHSSLPRQKSLFPLFFFGKNRHGQQVTALQLIGRTVLGAFCVLPSFFGMHPLSAAILVATGFGINGLFTLFGVLIGCLLLPSFGTAAKYALTSLLAVGSLFCFRSSSLKKQRWFGPMCTVLSLFSMELVFDGLASPTLPVVGHCLCELGIGAMATLLYQIALGPYLPGSTEKDGPLQGVALAFLALTVFCTFLPLELFHTVSLGRTLALVLVMTLGLKGGAGAGAAGGLAVGFVIDLSCGAFPCYSLIFGFASLTGGLFSRYGKLHFVAAFDLANAFLCLLLWKWLQSISVLYEVFCASVILLILPSKVLARASAWFPAERAVGGNLRVRQYASQRVSHASAAFGHLYSTVSGAAGKIGADNNIAVLFDRAAESSCRSCKRSGICWQQSYNNTLDTLNHMVPVMNSRGYLIQSDLPERFVGQCLAPDKLVDSINRELRSLQYRRQYGARLQEKLDLAFDQYRDISQVLASVAADLEAESAADPYLEARVQKFLKSQDVQATVSAFRDRNQRLHIECVGTGLGALTRDKSYLEHFSHLADVRLCSDGYHVGTQKLTLLEAEPYAVSVGIASVKKNGQSICGDKGISFKTEEGFLYILLSDGMGTGEAAARCSGNTVHILEDFLRSGIAPEIALRILNNLMLLRCEKDLSSATVDLLEINLFSGQAVVYKYGAAPSYLVREDKLRRIRSNSFSLGMAKNDEGAPDKTELSLRDGDRLIMLSDGALTQGQDDWILPALNGCTGLSSRETARRLLETVTDHKKAEDDSTVLFITMESRK